jgi:capsular exopolysaccharide synthesis family protein
MDQIETEHEFDAREYVRVLRRRAWLIAAVIVVVTALGLGVSLLQTKVYTASATVLVPQDVHSSVNPGTPQSFTSPDLLNRQLQNEISFAQSDAVRAAIRKKVGRVPNISITPVPNTDSLRFSVDNNSPSRAAGEANAYAGAYLTERRRSKTNDYLTTATALRQQIFQLRARRTALLPTDPRVPGIVAALASLQSSLADLQASGELSRVGGQVIDHAVAPSSPTSPKVARNGLIAAFIGLLIGIWIAFIVDRLDDTIKSKHDLEDATAGLMVLALIPWAEGWRNTTSGYVVSVESPRSASSEAYRTLRTAVDVLRRNTGLRVIGVTSARAEEGKTATVANLGVALARAGRSVVVVDCDFRRPRIHTFFGLPNTVGLSSVLLGEATMENAIQEVPDQPNLHLLASGEQPPDPSEFMSINDVQGAINGLEYDVVLVDCPPVLPVPDALQLSNMVDGLVLVAAAQHTHKRQVSRTVEMLQQIDAPIVGVVLNGVQHHGGYDYGYYDYGYSSNQHTSPALNGQGPAAKVGTPGRRWRRKARA